MDEFLLILSESTVYLLGDPDLITLWEDAHSRKLMNKKAQNQKLKIIGTEPKMLGTIKTHKDLKNKLFSVGTKLQNRAFIRKENKRRKKELIQTRKEEENMIKKNPNLKKGCLTKDFSKKYSKKWSNLEDLGDAEYLHTHKAIYTTHDNPHKTILKHELQHHKDYEYLQSQKGGHTKARQLFAKADKVGDEAAQGNFKKYEKDPTEYNALRAEFDDITPSKAHEILNKALHKKSTPSQEDYWKERGERFKKGEFN